MLCKVAEFFNSIQNHHFNAINAKYDRWILTRLCVDLLLAKTYRFFFRLLLCLVLEALLKIG